MTRAVAIAVAALIAGLVPAVAKDGVLTAHMIQDALERAHVQTAPGSVMLLMDASKRWQAFRLDKFEVRVHDNHFTIEGDTSPAN